MRRSELLSLRWTDVDLDRQEVNLRETKAGRSHVVPLAAPAVDLLSGLPREVGNPHVFPSLNSGGHLYDLKKPWRRIRDRAGLEDVRLHDLRRTVGSFLALDGASLQLIGKILNHTEAKTTVIYARLTEDATRQALERHGERILSLDHRTRETA